MKTLTDGHHIFRVSDAKADALMKEDRETGQEIWSYIPKRIWKATRKEVKPNAG